MNTEIETKPETGSDTVASGDLLDTPVELLTTKALRCVGCIANINGTQIGILAGNVDALAAAWARLVPTVPFDPKTYQPIVVMSAKEPLFNVSNDKLTDK